MQPSHKKSLRNTAATVVALDAILLLPGRAPALFHVAVIDEVMTSYGGDSDVQFVEILQQSIFQNFVEDSVLGAFDASGTFIGDVLIVPSDVPNGGNDVRWVMATSAWETLTGNTADFIMPAGLPTGGGMVCWGAPGTAVPLPGSWIHSDPENYVDCLAYGTYSGPSNTFVGDPMPHDADGHSLRRVSDTEDNRSDFRCVNLADPEDNAGTISPLVATTPCPSLCYDTPINSCLSGAKFGFQQKNKEDDTKDQIKWKLTRGDGFLSKVLADPDETTRYELCIYDEDAEVPSLVGSLAIPAGAGWTSKDLKGFKYKDKLGMPDGVTRAQLKTGKFGKAKVQLKAKGSTLNWPTPVSGSTFYNQDSDVTVQLLSDETDTCWTSEFPALETKKNDGVQFKTKGP